MKNLVIIPAYNEEGNILKTYKSIIDKKLKYKYDILVINDGSTDKTENILIENNIPHIKLINNLGIGGAVQTGYKYAYENNYDLAIQFDGDGQHDSKCLDKLVDRYLETGANMVIGSRFIIKDKNNFNSSFTRRLGINIISFVIKAKFNKKIFDTTSGFRLIDAKLIKLFSNNYPSEYPEPISTVNAINNNYEIDEISVKMHERTEGVSSITSWKSIYYMFNVIITILNIKKVKK